MTEENKNYTEALYKKWNNTVDALFPASPKDRLLFLAGNAVSALCAFILSLSKLPILSMSEGYPLTDAFICASGRYSTGAFVGAVFSAYFNGGHPSDYIAVLAVMLIRFIGWRWISDRREAPFTELPSMRLASCALLSLLRTGMRLTAGNLSDDVWLSLAVTLIIPTVICGVFLLYLSGYPEKYGYARTFYYISMTLLFSAFVYTGADISYAGFSVGAAGAIFLTLSVSRFGGALSGTVLGLLLGLLSSKGYGNAVPTALIGLTSGLFFSVGATTAAGISATVGATAALLLNGYSALSFIPQAVIAVAISSPVIKYGFLPEDFPFPHGLKNREIKSNSDKLTSSLHAEDAETALEAMSSAFSELSTLANTPTASEIAEIADIVRSELCESCPMSPICWESNAADTHSAVSAIVTVNSDSEAIPENINEHCIHRDAFLDTVTSKAKIFFSCDRADKELFSISGILTDVAKSVEASAFADRECEKKVTKALHALGHKVNAVAIIGKEHKKLYLYGCDKIKSAAELEKLRKTMSNVCGVNFSLPDISGGTAVFTPSAVFSADYKLASSAKEGEALNGDRGFSFTHGDYYYSVIADGMGSGAEASDCSEYASVAIEKLLCSGITLNSSANILNGMLSRRFGECFSTLDIMRLDLVSGRTDFLKSGAPPSYIIRNGSIYCVNARSSPVGISNETISEEIHFELRDGDTVIMMSDGIASDPENGAWLTGILSCGDLKSPGFLADEILASAIKNHGKCDDMTVSVSRIHRK